MSEAACAEEEETLRRVIALASELLETIRRLERGEITVPKTDILSSMLSVRHAHASLMDADSRVYRNITACRGCAAS